MKNCIQMYDSLGSIYYIIHDKSSPPDYNKDCYIPCDGRTIRREEYPLFFKELKKELTEFAVPNMPVRAPVDVDGVTQEGLLATFVIKVKA